MVNGEWVDPAARTIVLDDGLVRGDGVFEGLRSYAGRIRTPEMHLDRMERSCREIRLPFDRDLIRTELGELEARLGPEDIGVRIILTRGGQRILREEPLPALPSPVTLAPVAHRITPLLAASKTVSYAANMQANRLAQDAGADQALFVRADDGAVLEGPTFSVGWLDGDTFCFPPLSLGILDSITRRLVFECVEGVREVEAKIDDLAGAEGVLVVSTVTESIPVGRIVGVGEYPSGGARLTEVRAALAERVRADVSAHSA